MTLEFLERCGRLLDGTVISGIPFFIDCLNNVIVIYENVDRFRTFRLEKV